MVNVMFVLPSDFWSHFIEHYWDKRPFVIKQPFASPIANSEDIMSGLKNARDRFRATDPETRTRFYTEDGFRSENIQLKDYLPDTTDLSVAEYFQQTNQKLGGRGFVVIVNDFQMHSARIWYRTREFLRELVTRMPMLTADAVLFLGNYEKTPLGIHADEYTIFLFVVDGRKKIYLWPEQYFRDRFDERRDLDFQILRKDAITLEGEVGDVLFWPSSYWHVGESVGGLSVTLSLGLMPVDPGQQVWDHLRSNMDAIVGNALYPDGASGYLTEASNRQETISKVFKLATNVLRNTGRDPNFGMNLEGALLNRLTGGGFKKLPPPLPLKTLSDGDFVRGCPAYPIVWVPTADQHIVCSANGHSFTIPADSQVIKMLDQLNGGEALLVRDLIEKYAGTREWDGVEFVANPEGIRAVLSKLYSLRGLTNPHTG
jgi:50S ribosomal protein L16 3-hydroxylase